MIHARQTILLLAFAVPATLLAQPQTTVQIAVPAQFATAHTAFLASAGAPALGQKEKLAVNMIYDSLYQQLQANHQYQLVASPADADLAMEVSILVATGTTPNEFNSPVLRLVVRDTKTHTLLWTIDAPLKGAFREKTFQHNIDEAATSIMDDLKSLSSGKVPQP